MGHNRRTSREGEENTISIGSSVVIISTPIHDVCDYVRVSFEQPTYQEIPRLLYSQICN